MTMPRLLISDKSGRISILKNLEAVGMRAGFFFRIDPNELIKLPPGSQLFTLPDRTPVYYDTESKSFSSLWGHTGVAAFISPGYTATYNSAYRESNSIKPLPLFSYAACAHYKGEIYVAAVRVDRDRRHDRTLIDIGEVKRQAGRLKKAFPGNRLIPHLEKCALIYGCCGAQNFFLARYECPLPVSPSCNARCAGCISYQSGKICSETQPRISFTPSPEELSEIAIFHITNVKNTVVSFGQGCEGEPLLKGRVIEKAIKLIRKNTAGGMININTNASKPDIISRLFDAGLNSMRVSLNSVKGKYYTRYYKPTDYKFRDVVRSIDAAKKKKGFLSINYLVMPGFTDWHDEFEALNEFIKYHRIDMIQWRNLNFDPLLYFKILRAAPDRRDLMGVRQIIDSLRKYFPKLMMGYFNPLPRAAASRHPRRRD